MIVKFPLSILVTNNTTVNVFFFLNSQGIDMLQYYVNLQKS